jgi:hypothetical protein
MTASRNISRFVFAAVVALSSACASTQANDNELRVVQPKAKKDPYVIKKDELMDPAIVSRDALTALRLLRPGFFSYRGPITPNQPDAGKTQISQDYGPLRPLDELSSMNTMTFVEVRYLPAEAAMGRFGLNAQGGPVIVLVSNAEAR